MRRPSIDSISLITPLVGAFQKKKKKNLSEIDADDASGKKKKKINKTNEERN